MVRRGDELRQHILWTAKDVFLEFGFERASMDVVASRAETSKRSLYAHFGSKEKLFSAIIELVRGLLLNRLGKPEDYGEDPVEALTIFCARYVEAITVGGSIQMLRLNAAEAARFPAGAAQYFHIVFGEVQTRVASYIAQKFSSTTDESDLAAQAIIGQALFPRLPRAIFGLDPLSGSFGDLPSPNFDIASLHAAVAASVEQLRRP